MHVIRPSFILAVILISMDSPQHRQREKGGASQSVPHSTIALKKEIKYSNYRKSMNELKLRNKIHLILHRPLKKRNKLPGSKRNLHCLL